MMIDILERIEKKLNKIALALGVDDLDTPLRKGAAENSYGELPMLTTKQHAALQMVLRGAGNVEIADRFNVSVNTSKVYVRAIAKKLLVKSRGQIIVKVLDVFRSIDDNSYRIMSGGLPKDWDENYSEPDPFSPLYKFEKGEVL